MPDWKTFAAQVLEAEGPIVRATQPARAPGSLPLRVLRAVKEQHPMRRVLYLLWAGAGFVLLIGALNIANLSLARGNVRMRELATRMALGAGRLRLTRQLIVEGVLLAGVGGLAGLGAGAALLRGLESGGLPRLPNASSIGIDPPVVGDAIALSPAREECVVRVLELCGQVLERSGARADAEVPEARGGCGRMRGNQA